MRVKGAAGRSDSVVYARNSVMGRTPFALHSTGVSYHYHHFSILKATSRNHAKSQDSRPQCLTKASEMHINIDYIHTDSKLFILFNFFNAKLSV